MKGVKKWLMLAVPIAAGAAAIGLIPARLVAPLRDVVQAVVAALEPGPGDKLSGS